MRGWYEGADRLGWNALALSHALLHALWSEEKDVMDAKVRVDVANALGLDGRRLLELQDTPAGTTWRVS